MKQRRIGRITVGFLFILLGILLLANLIGNVPITHLLTKGWPIIFVLLGIEVIIFHLLKKEEKLQFDFWSIIFFSVVALIIIGGYSFKIGGITDVFSGFIDPKYSVKVDQALEVSEDIEEVKIDIPNGRINIFGTDENEAIIHGDVKLNAVNQTEANSLAQEYFTTKIEGNTLHIKLNKADDLRNTFLFFGTNMKANLDIHLPDYLIVEANISNGRLSAANLQNDGTFSITNGNVILNNLLGHIQVSSSNSKLELSNISGTLRAQTTNGAIEVENIAGDMNLRSTNGKITVESSTLSGDWEIRTTNGAVEIKIPEDSHAVIQASTTNGEIEGNINWHISGNRNNNGTATVGDGKHNLDLRTTNGKISVQQN